MYGCLHRRKVKRCIIQIKKKVNELFGRKMSEDANGNRKLFWKEVSNVKGGCFKFGLLLLTKARIKVNGAISCWVQVYLCGDTGIREDGEFMEGV